MPRTSQVSTEEFVDVIRTYENVIFKDETTGTVCVGPSHEVWNQISFDLTGKISKKSAYTWLKCNRKGIIELLGRTCDFVDTNRSSESNDRDEHFDEDEQLPSNIDSKRFSLNVSFTDWTLMGVGEVRYHEHEKSSGRRYVILQPGWTSIFHEYFWKETKLPCSISYKRAKVYQDGFNFCVISAVCTSCSSKLTAVLQKEPTPNDNVLPFDCNYVGPYEHCAPSKKRRMNETLKRQFVEEQIEKGISAVAIRRQCANERMDFGDPEPSHIPSSNALRLAKSRVMREKWLAEDAIIGICKLKYMSEFLNCIHDVGYDRFFCHYWTSNQMNIYREYVKGTKYAIVSIDATGGLVRKPTLTSGRKTKEILLYNIVVNDRSSEVQLSVGCMLSERHDNNSICHWLVEWLRGGAPCPKEVVTDMSLALMSGVVRAFTPHTTLWGYIQFCYDIIQKVRDVTSANMPCLIRCDVAHVIKLITTWKVFHSKDPRVKEFIIRVLGQILLSEEIDDVKQLLEDLFFLLYSKTDGKANDGTETLAERGRKFLYRRISTGEKCQLLSDAFEIGDRGESCSGDLFLGDGEESCTEDSFPIVNDVNDGISLTERNKGNPFFMMVYKISEKCKRRAENEEGDHDNLYWAPLVVSRIIDLCSYLPLWSSIMCPVVGFGSNPPSSAPVESDFADLKNRVLRKHKLPMRVDDFLQTHLKSMGGTAKLTYATMMSAKRNVEGNLVQSSLEREVSFQDIIEPAPITTCPSCAKDDLPSGAHKCMSCMCSVHAMEGCSFSVGDDEGNGKHRLCISCKNKGGDENRIFESQAMENWRNINASNANNRKTSSHLPPRLSQTTASPLRTCPCCANGDLPSGAHKCISCGRSVHVIEGCSFSVGDEEGYGERRICTSCKTKSGDESRTFESETVENLENSTNPFNAEKRKASSHSPSVLSRTITSPIPCLSCANGDLPSGAHKCISCRRSVHVIEGCSFSLGDEEGYGERRVCISCKSKDTDENQKSEGPSVKRSKTIHTTDKKKPSLYLTPKPELLHRNPHSRIKKKIIGLLKNGSLPEFKTKKLKTGNYTFSNTCAFDSVVQVLAVAYCDSEEYYDFVWRKEKEYVLWGLIKNLLKDGVNVQTYMKRATILSELCAGRSLTSNLTYISVEQSIDVLLLKLLKRYPSVTLETNCRTCNRKNSETKVIFNPLVTVGPSEISMTYLQNLLTDVVNEFCEYAGHTKRKNSKKECSINREVRFGPHLIFNLVTFIENEESDIGNDVPMTLNSIPTILRIRHEEYFLRGCASTTEYQQSVRAVVKTSSIQNLRSIGHYKSYTYRQPLKVWQLYDDQKDQGIHVKNTTTIFPQVLFYSK